MKYRVVIVYALTAAMMLTALTGLVGCAAREAKKHTRFLFLMDTQVDITYYHPSAQVAQTDIGEIFAEMQRLEKILSRQAAGSDLHRINEAAGKEAVEVNPETIFVLRRALEFAELSDGAFDPTIAPLLEVWGFGGDFPAVPAPQELSRARELVNYRLVEIDAEKGSVFLPVPGMRLDLGGIAKGYIVDRGQESVRELASASFINAGGDISIRGRKPSEEDWRVAVQHPDNPDRFMAIITMEEGSVATSGDYQRYFEAEGQRYHHILDPHTGMPALELSSVTVVAADTMTADALSTAIFVLGMEKGIALVESLPGVDAILMDNSGDLKYTSGLEGRLEIMTD